MTPTLAQISAYLLDAERREPDYWHQQDYRLASVLVDQVEQGDPPNYDLAFARLFGKWPRDVTWWWRDREKLLFLSEYCNCPTPLLLVNYAEELLNGEWIEIPDHGFVPRAAAKRFLILKRHEHRQEYMREYMAERRTESKAKAVCIECAQPVCPESKSRCAKHHLASREASARHFRRKLASGICRNCSNPVEPPSRYHFKFHREKHNARTRESGRKRYWLRKAQKAAAAA